MKKHILYILSILIIGFAGCKTKTTINQDEAGEVITDYLKAAKVENLQQYDGGLIYAKNLQHALLT